MLTVRNKQDKTALRFPGSPDNSTGFSYFPTQAYRIYKAGTVTAPGLSVRAEPSADSDRIDILPKNSRVILLGQQNGCYQIARGYISSRYIRLSPSPSSTVTCLSSAEDILWLQKSLNLVLYSNEKLAEDGKLGAETSSAIRSYWKQLGWGMSAPDQYGRYYAGPRTLNALILRKKA